jgi:hypothetical protein
MRDFLTAVLLMEGNTIVPPLFRTSPNFLLALRQLYFGRAIAVVRLRRNQNSAMLPFLDQIEDQTKASRDFKLISLSAQSTHLDYPAGSNWVTGVYRVGGQAQKFHRHLRLLHKPTRLSAAPP